MERLAVEFHGVRGSVPVAGASTVRTGGNTACVEVRAGRTVLLLDAGTGLRAAGERLAGPAPVEATLLLSHLRWDRIQGLPFFLPLYQPGGRVDVVTGLSPGAVEQALRRQMSPPFFPVSWDEVSERVDLHAAPPGQPYHVDDVVVHAARLARAEPAHAWRIEHGGRAIVYAGDAGPGAAEDPWLRRLAQGADLLICDAACGRQDDGWAPRGAPSHRPLSTRIAAAELAAGADVGALVLCHFGPSATDAAVDELEVRARAIFPATRAAREGLVLRLEEREALADAA